MSFDVLSPSPGIGQPRVRQVLEGLPRYYGRKDLWRFCGVRNRPDLQVCCKRLIDAWPQTITIPSVAATWNRQQAAGQRIPPTPIPKLLPSASPNSSVRSALLFHSVASLVALFVAFCSGNFSAIARDTEAEVVNGREQKPAY